MSDQSSIYFTTREDAERVLDAMRQVLTRYTEDAERVLDAMRQVLTRYTEVTVSDLKDLAGLPDKRVYLDQAEGWTNLDSIEIQESPKGFFINLPATSPVA